MRMGRCEVLRGLVFPENWPHPEEAQAFMNNLAGHGALRKIHVDQPFVIGDCCKSLGYLLCNSDLENSLSVAAE